MNDKPAPGTRVRLTGEFLRNTGQVVGGEAFSRWTVVVCACDLCTASNEFVAVDELAGAGQRHFNIHNLERSAR